MLLGLNVERDLAAPSAGDIEQQGRTEKEQQDISKAPSVTLQEEKKMLKVIQLPEKENRLSNQQYRYRKYHDAEVCLHTKTRQTI